MFCPECGTLAFPGPSGKIKCPNYNCGYNGTAENKVMMEDGSEIDISKVSSSSKVETRDRRVIVDSEQQQGVLTSNTYICPKCDSDSVYAELKQTRASDEPETRILTCAECGRGWREY
ncbi:MAG: transcription factor S [Candidatus Poseidoniales archaeon]|nr:transcription factor S [Candidatus Poseidoniales archaeon]